MGRLVRESAVGCLGGGSGGDWCALPIGFHRGKARYAALEMPLEGFCALCLQSSGEGKRGGMLWKWLWWGQMRFAYSGGGLEEVGFCPEMQLFQTKFPSGIGLPGPSEAENLK